MLFIETHLDGHSLRALPLGSIGYSLHVRLSTGEQSTVVWDVSCGQHLRPLPIESRTHKPQLRVLFCICTRQCEYVHGDSLEYGQRYVVLSPGRPRDMARCTRCCTCVTGGGGPSPNATCGTQCSTEPEGSCLGSAPLTLPDRDFMGWNLPTAGSFFWQLGHVPPRPRVGCLHRHPPWMIDTAACRATRV